MTKNDAHLATLEQITRIKVEEEKDWSYRRMPVAINQIKGACARGQFEVVLKNIPELGEKQLIDLGYVVVKVGSNQVKVSWK